MQARHAVTIRVTHWITTISFIALLITGAEIVVSHPRFYWGETGNVLTPPLFQLAIPSSRSTVPTAYNYVLPDQNGWSRYLHFQAGWVLVFAGVAYGIFGIRRDHFRRNFLLTRDEMTPRALWQVIVQHLRFRFGKDKGALSYNPLQRITYALVIFVLFPVMIWTGLAMSPAVASVFPAAVAILGGQQSARTIHFFVTGLLCIFLFVHVLMVWLTGFWLRMRAMTIGGGGYTPEESR